MCEVIIHDSEVHNALVHPHGEECLDGCDCGIKYCQCSLQKRKAYSKLEMIFCCGCNQLISY